MNSYTWDYHADTAQPSSKTELEHHLSRSQIYPIAHPIRNLWNPRTCPSHLLPYLAWAVSVDYWDDKWPEAVKRDVIAASYRIHRQKGTIAALKAAAAPFGLQINVKEWWQKSPMGTPGTFELIAMSENAVIGEEAFRELVRLLGEVKPLSRHIGRLSVGVITRGRLKPAAATIAATTLTVYPYIKPIINMPPAGRTRAAAQRVEIITLNPKVES